MRQIGGVLRFLPRGLIWILALACLARASQARAGTGEGASAWLTRMWETDAGLPDNTVSGLAHRPGGHLWVSTHGGFLRFNGTRFEAFSLTHLKKGAPNRVVRALFQDSRGDHWLVMDRGGVLRISPQQVGVILPGDRYPGLRVTSLAEDASGAVWVAYAAGVIRIRNDQAEPMDQRLPGPSSGPCLVAADRSGRIWVARGTALGVFDGDAFAGVASLRAPIDRIHGTRDGGLWVAGGGTVYRVDPGEAEPRRMAVLPRNAAVRSMFEDTRGGLWIGTATEGLFRLAPTGVERVPTSHPEILCLGEDSEGNLWAGTGGGGLNQIRARTMAMLGTEEGLPFPAIRSVSSAPDGTLWVATENGKLARRQGDVWEVMGPENGWTEAHATSVSAEADGVWVGTRDQGLRWWARGEFKSFRQAEGLRTDSVRCVLRAADGSLYVATDAPSSLAQGKGGRFSPIGLPPGIASIRALVQGRDGTVWLGTSDGYVLRVSGAEAVPETALAGLPVVSVRCLETTPDGSLWIGYAGAGVARVRDGRVWTATRRHGLGDDHISQVLHDAAGDLWFTGNYGVFRVPAAEWEGFESGRVRRMRCVMYGAGEGLPNFQPNYSGAPNAVRSADDRLWLATRNGVLMVQPAKEAAPEKAPPVILEQVLVDESVTAMHDSQSPLRMPPEARLVDLRPPNASLRVLPGHRKIEFQFAALTFTSPENVHYRYRLEGFDGDWVEAGPQRSAAYPRLPAGDYRFVVTACNSAGVWNEAGRALELRVFPFFWQTWWFRTGVLLVFTGTVVGAVRYVSFRRLRRELDELERQAALEKERGRIARDMHDEVGSKLSRLSLLSDMAARHPGLPSDARHETMEVSETAREAIRSLEEIVWSVNPANDTLHDLIHFFCRYTEDFLTGSGIECRFDLPPAVPGLRLPPDVRHHLFLAGKEALNNTLKHAGASRVEVQFRAEGAEWLLRITDNGRGFDPQAGPQRRPGNGLANMRDRLAAVGGRFHLDSRPGAGTTVTFYLPPAGSRDVRTLSDSPPGPGSDTVSTC